MTLINYLTRVHFADGVLEEALWAELSRSRQRRPLIVIDAASRGTDAVERLLSGLPPRSDAVIFKDCPKTPNEAAIRRLSKLYHSAQCDAIIAFGGRGAIEFAKLARLAVADPRPMADIALSGYDNGQPIPDLYVAPGIAGFGASVNALVSVRDEEGQRHVITSRKLIPTVVICDPTLSLGAGANESASAGVGAFLSCVEPYLSGGYNPPADGIALDGLQRALRALPLVMSSGGLEERREMAAAALNGSLAQEKGPGAAYALVDALCNVSAAAPDNGAVARLVLPGVLRINGGRGRDARRMTVRDMMALTPQDCLAEGVEAFLKPLPLPQSLSEMGVTTGEMARAAEEAARDLRLMRSRRAIGAETLHDVLVSVH